LCAAVGPGHCCAVPGSGGAPAELMLAWVDRKGVAQPLPAPPRPYTNPRLSPDGRLAAVQIGNDIWIYDLARNTLTRLTFEGIKHQSELDTGWKTGRLLFREERRPGHFWRLADASGSEESLFTDPGLPRPQGGFTPDGRSLMYTTNDPKTGSDLWVLPLEGKPETRKPRVLTKSAGEALNAVRDDASVSADPRRLHRAVSLNSLTSPACHPSVSSTNDTKKRFANFGRSICASSCCYCW
jgi:hypothetical protein